MYLFFGSEEEKVITVLLSHWSGVNTVLYVAFQLRMDFSTFVITGPSTLTSSIFYNLLGSIAAKSNLKIGQVANLATNCLTDTFTVTGSGGYGPPVICGTNTGYHSMKFFH
jgi:hypothetical protein